MFYSNSDLSNIVTPVNIKVYEQLLIDSKFDNHETAFLVKGFTDGFDIGYRGDPNVHLMAPNLRLENYQEEVVLWNKVMKEVKERRYAGPYTQVPYDYYIQSPIGLVPKDNGRDHRLIFHLLYPRGRNLSVNDNTPEHLCSVKYPDFCDAVRMCMRAGKSCRIAKSDLKAAFRNLGILRSQWRLLIMKACNPIDRKYYFFVEKCLTFGASISCSHFQRFSKSISHIVRFITGVPNLSYLDDYFFVALLTALCNQQVQTFLHVCQKINFPVSIEKTFWSTTVLTFLGFLIDTVSQCVSLPVDKIEKGRNLIKSILEKKAGGKVTIKQLQKICGFLNFIGRYIVPGRAFTRCLYAYTKTDKLKPHHHVKIMSEMRGDLLMWEKFLNHTSVYCRPFMDFSEMLIAEHIQFYTDASGRIGFSGICGQSWMSQKWPEGFIQNCNPSIGHLELYALVAGVLNWIQRFRNRRVILMCDNLSTVSMVNTTSSSCKNCMVLIRILVLQCLIYNVRVFARHLRSMENFYADALSRD